MGIVSFLAECFPVLPSAALLPNEEGTSELVGLNGQKEISLWPPSLGWGLSVYLG